MLEVRRLAKWFGRVPAVRDVSLGVARGQVVGLLGTNGAGKSTTLRMITGYLPPDDGWARIEGFDTLTHSRQARRRIGYLPESAPLYPEMRTRDYLVFCATLQGLRGRARTAAVDRVLDRCWLRQVRRKRIAHLSKGYRQRVGLAAALVHDPPVLVLDEPTNGLDPSQIHKMRDLVHELGRDRAVLVSSHILPEVESMCDRVVIMARGRVRADATPEQLARRGQSAYIIELHASDAATLASRLTLLRDVPGVRRAETLDEAPSTPGWVRFRVEPQPTAPDLRETIGAAAHNASLIVREFRPERPTLERVFLEIIEQEEEGLALMDAMERDLAGDPSLG